jgi:Spy/CpxP family protein refolding chaperone
VKKTAFAVLAFVALSVVGSTTVIAQSAAPPPAAAASGSADGFSDQQMALLRKDIRTIKKQLIAANLTLTDGQATKFWPVYEQYSAEFGKINETRSAVIKEYADGYGQLTDEQADNLIRRWLDTDIAAAQLRQKYVPIFRKVLPGKQAATFFQLDRRISMMIDVQLTSQLPLVQSQD